jgi:lipoprotein-anchoring transpeptidase ErfK/SrfK
MSIDVSRRQFLIGASSLAAVSLAGCATSGSRRLDVAAEPTFSDYYLQMYAAMPYERFPIPAVDLSKLDPNFFRTEVDDPTGERPGTVVVRTSERYLYLVGEGGKAIRYGVGIGREGFTWSGRGAIGRKAEWPVWTPPAEMIARQPELEEFRNGQEPGLTNPLGARAMYIYRDGIDSGYRLHGTGETATIGKAVSSGCVRLLHQDVIDLYGRVPVGTKVLVQA